MTADQLTLDLAAGRAARDFAMERVADPPWAVFAHRAIRALARRNAYVCSDDVWEELDGMGVPRPQEGRAMGPVMAAAVHDGLLVPDHFTSGGNPKHHADVMRVYRSLVWEGGT